ncbi:hypothetical protein ACFQV2_31545 [Actinokineospora soli]|uniref:Uncharacterized protein n=1 Tax=Actinokineospora soli TaxID=1048753 RepID=A0ABW2TTU1_9PSEU
MQVSRFEDVVYALVRAYADAETRARMDEPSESTAEWRAFYDGLPPRDDQRPETVPSYALLMQVSTELDLLVVAVRNVLRAQRRLPDHLRTSMTDQEAIELLRNIAEHWDEIGGRSAERLAAAYPDVSATSYTYNTKEIWIGNAIPLSRVIAWLARVQSALVEALSTAGISVPDDLVSMVEGDDELPWPHDRLRFRYWALPLAEKKDWPTEGLPDDAAELLGQLFLNRRRRDHAD